MSRVSCWVQGSDNYYYKNPIIESPGLGAFICFDDDDPPELVIRTDTLSLLYPKGMSRPAQYKRARETLQAFGLSFSNLRFGHSCGRLFGESQFYPAYSVFFTLNKPLPVEIITKFDAKATKPQGECVFYHLEGAFPHVA